MKSIIENYILKSLGKQALEDINVAISAKFNIFNMINRSTWKHKDSEISFRAKTIKNILQKSLPKRLSRTGSPGSRVLYVNGILTPYFLANHQANILAKLLDEDVEMLHNETQGLYKDLIECSQGREGLINNVAQEAIDTIIDKLSYDGHLTLVAHSQGAIIIASALSHLSTILPSKTLSRITFVSFGAGFQSCQLPPCIKTEHFANSLDPVVHLGLLNDNFPCSGECYIREAKGHFFIADYLIPMMSGKTYGESEFENRILTISKNYI